jgi:hypothetical protein
MAAVSSIIAAAALVVSAVGVKAQMDASKQQAKQAKESMALQREGQAKQQEATNLQTMRAKRAAVRDAQIRKAEIQASAARNEAQGSSPVVGAQGSVGTQAASNVSFLDQMSTLGSQAAASFGEAQAVANRPISGWGSTLTGIGSTMFSGSEKLGNLFTSAANWFTPTPAPTAMNNFFDGN